MREAVSSSGTEARDAFGARAARRLSRRRWRIIATVALVCAQLAILAARSPQLQEWLGIGRTSNCAAAGISTPQAREGKCVRHTGLFSSTTYDVVDRAHTLHMPEYDVRLTSTRIAPTRVTGSGSRDSFYRGEQGMLVSYELQLANTTGAPLRLGSAEDLARSPHYPHASLAELLVPAGGMGNLTDSLAELLNGRGAPEPSLVRAGEIAPHAAIAGWVSFVVPIRMLASLTMRPADLNLYRVGRRAGYTGQIRLWK